MNFIRIPQRLKSTIKIPSQTNRVEKLYAGLLSEDAILRRVSLSKAITLIETTHPVKRKQAEYLLSKLLKSGISRNLSQNRKTEASKMKTALRIGLTGPPGAGKSTFIEALGTYITEEKGLNVAVLAVDPSSSKTGGSLLGDKTRMEELSRNMKAYIRPSPAGGTLGGVARTTFESCILCEAAGYDVILVETVGVGQSEYKVADLVDMFTLIIPPAGGDELQGIKRGIIEVVDAVMVNKSDGDLIPAARRIQMEYLSALKFMPPNYPNHVWKPPVVRVSSMNGDGIDQSWGMMESFFEKLTSLTDKDTGEGMAILEKKRIKQRELWMWHHVQDRLLEEIKTKDFARRISQKVVDNDATPGTGADEIIRHFLGDKM